MNLIITVLITLGLFLGTQTSMANGLNQLIAHDRTPREASAISETKEIVSEIESSGDIEKRTIGVELDYQLFPSTDMSTELSIESVKMEREKWFPKGLFSTYKL